MADELKSGAGSSQDFASKNSNPRTSAILAGPKIARLAWHVACSITRHGNCILCERPLVAIRVRVTDELGQEDTERGAIIA